MLFRSAVSPAISSVPTLSRRNTPFSNALRSSAVLSNTLWIGWALVVSGCGTQSDAGEPSASLAMSSGVPSTASTAANAAPGGGSLTMTTSSALTASPQPMPVGNAGAMAAGGSNQTASPTLPQTQTGSPTAQNTQTNDPPAGPPATQMAMPTSMASTDMPSGQQPADDCTNGSADCQSGGAATSPSDSSNPSGGMPPTDNMQNTGGMSSMDPPAELGDDNPYPPINGGMQGWASRYWDCCKQSCAWSGNASDPVASCSLDNTDLGVNDDPNACGFNSADPSGTFTCHRMAPWAHSTTLSYGYAAINGVQCGQCFQVQFTGSSHNAGDDPGCQALSGKTMIVQASNIGGIEQGQFDILIPGGGVGLLNACSLQWGVDNSQLGEQYGGFLSTCKQQNPDYEAAKQCVRDKCDQIFASQGLSELHDGCMWFVDWFEAADNPSFVYQSVDCPAELTQNAH